MLDSGEVTLSSTLDSDNQYFDVFTTSSDFGFIEFPNFVGNFELGFALKDGELPLELFNTFSLDMASLDPRHSPLMYPSHRIPLQKWLGRGSFSTLLGV